MKIYKYTVDTNDSHTHVHATHHQIEDLRLILLRQDDVVAVFNAWNFFYINYDQDTKEDEP